jgi:hypothetical protein
MKNLTEKLLKQINYSSHRLLFWEFGINLNFSHNFLLNSFQEFFTKKLESIYYFPIHFIEYESIECKCKLD